MKKLKYFLFAILFLIPISVKADDIYSIDINVNIGKDGTASITEDWNVKASGGSEWYKQILDLGNSEVSNYVVYMDGQELKKKDNWDINGSMSDKKGYYGINYISNGLELCFGKYDYNNHKFTLKYDVSNYIFNTSDSQVLYSTLIAKGTTDKINVTVTSYYEFPDKLDVWGYGYEGYAYVKDGKITMTTEDGLDDEYMVLLVKFPLNTFETNNSYGKFTDFESVHNMAEQGAEKWNPNKITFEDIVGYAITALTFILPFGIAIFAIYASSKNGYGYVNNKTINKKEVPMFRELPCNKDIYYGNALMKLNNFGYKEANILGAIILKWVKEDKITLKNETKGIFNKNTSSIDLNKEVEFDNKYEEDLFYLMRAASGDGILEAKELEKWARNNYTKYLNIFNNLVNHNIEKLRTDGHIHTRQNKEECKQKNVMDDTIYKDSTELYGLKKFLENFARMEEKETMEVKVWDEYLMFAYLFGIADKVAKQLKNLYPEYVRSLEDRGLDVGTLMFIDHISTTSVSAASAAKSAAESYSAGGGGFSSFGGGGGSFGGGGGGSFGGR